MPDELRVAVVTGGNRGLGFETCRQLGDLGYRVVLTSRDVARGRASAETLRRAGGDVVHRTLDVTRPEAIRRLVGEIEQEFGRADVLVNNAAIYVNGGHGVLEMGIDALRRTLDTNLLGPLMLCQALVPLMRRRGYGRIVNVSSGAGQLSTMSDDTPAYNISKAALNALTRMVAEATAGVGILVNSVCPGWVRTDMGGRRAPRSAEEGADTIVWLATLPAGGPTGGFFRDRRRIPW